MEGPQHEGVLEDEAPQPQRHQKHHEAHACRDPEQARQSLQNAGTRPGCRQHDVAGTRRDRGHHGEKKKRNDLLGSRTLPPRIERPPQASLEDVKRMRSKDTRSGGEGLERSCTRPAAGWIASTRPVGGIELFRAWFAGEAYQKHRHDTYAIG
jgi:hypothetical protein